ncbi:MAG: alpha/beta hydrolase [Bacilli bacterium]
MAIVSLTTYSLKLKMNTLITLIIPDSPNMDKPMSERKVLWLLHGLSDNATAWIVRTRIEMYAAKHGIIVIMPSFDRSFYFDDVNGMDYFSHLTQELPEYFEKVFGLSRKKEDNFIAGLSMGGYGALKAGLTYPEQYFAAASFSGVIALEVLANFRDTQREKEFPFIIEEFKNLKTSKNNPVNLLALNKDIKLYVSCGLQDELLSASKIFEERAKSLGVEAEFVYRNGGHDWFFWDEEIENFLRFALY